MIISPSSCRNTFQLKMCVVIYQVASALSYMSSIMKYWKSGFISIDRITDSIYGRHMMRESAKRLIYRYCNSAASTAKRDFTPTWIIFVVLLNVILAAGIVCCIIFLIKPAFFPKKEN